MLLLWRMKEYTNPMMKMREMMVKKNVEEDVMSRDLLHLREFSHIFPVSNRCPYVTAVPVVFVALILGESKNHSTTTVGSVYINTWI